MLALRLGGKVSPRLISDRKEFLCYSCGYQFSATVGTIFHDSHLPLTVWFVTTYLMTQSQAISANQVKQMLGISYKTAWYLCHRIRKAMAEANRQKSDETVGIRETVSRRSKVSILRGRIPWNEIVIAVRKRYGDLQLFHADHVRSGALAKCIRENVAADVDVREINCFTPHPRKVIAASGVYIMGEVYKETVESAFNLLKRDMWGTWRKIRAKHLLAYLEELTFRINNRHNRYRFRNTLCKLIESSNLEYKTLTAGLVVTRGEKTTPRASPGKKPACVAESVSSPKRRATGK